MSKKLIYYETKKTRLKQDLHFYLDFYGKVSPRMQKVFDKEIQGIIERLKQLGKK